MRKCKSAIKLIIAGLIVLFCLTLYSKSETIYALTSCSLDLDFFITAAETQQPIPDATINLSIDDYSKDNGRTITLTTDAHGNAEFFREHNSCEEIIRPLRKTKLLIDLTWATITVSAKGYQPSEPIWLHTCKYENTGYSSVRHSHRLVFRIPLAKSEMDLNKETK
jgi:hypothetical protein